MEDPNDAPQSAGRVFSLRTSHGRIENDSDNCPLAQAAPVQSTNRSLSCVVLWHPSPSKRLGTSTKLPVTRLFDCNKKRGARVLPLSTGPLRRLFAPNPRYKSRHLSQRATTAQKVKAINRPTRVTSVIVISMLCAPNLSRAETSALCTEKC